MSTEGFNNEENYYPEQPSDDGPIRIPCCKCGKPTTWDSTYENLCYRCCRADNE